MRRRNVAGIVCWVAGLSIGSLASGGGSLEPIAIDGGYRMLTADLHVHSFPGDGALPPWDLAREARQRGLNVVALTNHNHMLSWRAALLAAPFLDRDVILLPGEEVTAPGFHMSAVGLAGAISWARTPRAVIEAIHAQGGLAIASHPADGFERAYDREAMAALDGVEAAHPMAEVDERNRRALRAFYARVASHHIDVAAIGSSDFHMMAPIGLCRTYVFVREATREGVMEALADGRTAACDARGYTYGRARWAEAADAPCRAASAAVNIAPILARGGLSALAVALAWLGLVMLCWGTLTPDS